MINSHFESVDEGDYPSLDAARRTAIATATKVAAESVLEGVKSAAVQVQIQDGDAVLARNVVTLSVSDLSGDQQLPD